MTVGARATVAPVDLGNLRLHANDRRLFEERWNTVITCGDVDVAKWVSRKHGCGSIQLE